MIGKLGRLEKREDSRTLQLERFVSLPDLPHYPAAFDWSMVKGSDLLYPMLRNDVLGCCVITSACHEIGTWTGQTGAEQVALDSEVDDAYHRLAGWDPSDPSTDRGAVMLDVAVRWRKEPIAGRTIKAFAEVNRSNRELVVAACYLFGGLWSGWALPIAWQSEEEEWTAGPGTTGQWAPASWGRHAVHVVAASPMGVVIRTWGGMRFATWAAWDRYCDEAYALVSDDTWTTLQSGRCPAGVDGAALDAALLAVIG